MNIMTYKEFRERYGFSERVAKRILNTEGCPVLPRKKNGSYYIPQTPFEKWYENEYVRLQNG